MRVREPGYTKYVKLNLWLTYLPINLYQLVALIFCFCCTIITEMFINSAYDKCVNIVVSLLQMVVIWCTERVAKGGEVSVVAKAHTDVDIMRMRIAAFDDTR